MAAGGRVAVIGAGWAGLACAVELAAAGVAVEVFEAAPAPGGRARSVSVNGRTLDNGQHLFIGAYSETLRLMRLVGADPQRMFSRLPLHLENPGKFGLSLPSLPAPLHLLAGLGGARGASWGDKLALLRFFFALRRSSFKLPKNGPVSVWLQEKQTSAFFNQHLLLPLALAALNTPPQEASAQVFANVLADSLGGGSGASDLLLQRAPLGELFPQPAARYLLANGGRLRLGARVRRLSGGPGAGWQVDGEAFAQVVLAVAPQHAARLLAGRSAQAPLLADLAAYTYQPVATLYLAYPSAVRLPFPMLMLPGRLGQWLFDRAPQGGEKGILACVFSARGAWQELDAARLALVMHGEISRLFASLGMAAPPPPVWWRLLCERRGVFTCAPDLPRPQNVSAESGLWLAGDYVQERYPATVESAVRSGVAAAHGVLRGCLAG